MLKEELYNHFNFIKNNSSSVVDIHIDDKGLNYEYVFKIKKCSYLQRLKNSLNLLENNDKTCIDCKHTKTCGQFQAGINPEFGAKCKEFEK
ncbi:MAG: hypothetical protein ABIG69_11865 [Bacteroidota bacterium]